LELLFSGYIYSIIGLLILSAFFSSSETALTACSEALLHQHSSNGNKKVDRVVKLQANRETVISAILLGNNLVNILASAIATNLLVLQYGNSGIIYATVLMTILIFIFAEVLPKTYAIRHSDSLVLVLAPGIQLAVWILSPINIFIHKIISVFLQFGRKKSNTGTIEHLRGAILLADTKGEMPKDEKNMLESVLDLEKVEVAEIMTHRSQIVSISINEPIKNILESATSNPFSRIPLWKDNSDDIAGFVHIRDLLRVSINKTQFKLSDILQTPWFIPETTTLSAQLSAFRNKNQQMAFVVDEYGVLQGLVTIEDILEDIVGQIEDEHDYPSLEIDLKKDGSVKVTGSSKVRDINRELDWNLPLDTASTIAGLVIAEAQRIPEEGEFFLVKDYKLTVKVRQRTKLTSIHITKEKNSI